MDLSREGDKSIYELGYKWSKPALEFPSSLPHLVVTLPRLQSYLPSHSDVTQPGTMTVPSILLVWFVLGLSYAHLDLYMMKEERDRILASYASSAEGGGESEWKPIYYIQNGLVNVYPLRYKITLSGSIPSLRFTWHNTRAEISSIKYELDVQVENSTFLQAEADIPVSGSVPGDRPHTWTVFLRCAPGLRESHQVDLWIFLSFYGLPPDPRFPTEVFLNWTKVCLHPPPAEEGGEAPLGPGDPALLSSPTEVIYIVSGAALGVLVVLILLALACYYRRSKYRPVSQQVPPPPPLVPPPPPPSSVSPHPYLLPGGSTTGSYVIMDHPRRGSSRGTPIIVDHGCMGSSSGTCSGSSRASTAWSLPVQLQVEEVEEGDEGKVMVGRDTSSSQLLLVKALHKERQDGGWRRFLQQGLSLLPGPDDHRVPSSAHILTPVQVVADLPRPLLLYPYAGINLKRYLQELGASGAEGEEILSVEQMTRIGKEVAAALVYIHDALDRVHGDLAARNCYVDVGAGTVRVCDAALASSLFPLDYAPGSRWPMRWMAPECLAAGSRVPGTWEQSRTSDVWSYGVFLWEVVTYGGRPYEELGDSDIFTYLERGFRLAKPPDASLHM
ncbi:unnamed protein product [Darwinula stevensoni]|uniref:Protein kinase domain-containing protein n=1 Tax=Darwinula stevensoni TaxID=69355 RepID=A0A7R8WXH6_9CRUS|nr:unnamed protein product [Darwinula stevensoni]CAG0878513.1 unnamed protein product [Darwinula stevensoni]